MNADPGSVFWLMEPLRGALIRAAVEWLDLPPGSRGLDLGCGIGLESRKLARAIAPGGSVVGLDLSPALLAMAGEDADEDTGAVDFTAGSWSALPFANANFDWVWSCDGVGYAPHTQQEAVHEIVRVLRPGGRAALLFWSGQSLLPGHPRLEAALNATRAGLAPFEECAPPELHAMRGLGWLRAAGLEQLRAQTLVQSVQAPLDAAINAALAALLEMRWGGCEMELCTADRYMYCRLCCPDSPDYILNAPDYYAFFTYSLFSGRAPEAIRV